jgi:predicted DNA-binding transcriptional regulator YafY
VIARHPDGAVDVALHIAGTTELESVVLSYGDKAEVLSPPVLRKKMGEVLRRAAARYET